MKSKKSHAYNKRKSIDTATDPYLLSEITYETAVCKRCHAVFRNKRWYLDEDLYQRKIALKGIGKVLCPACRKIKDNFPGGIIRIKGDFLKNHKNEILNMIRNEEQRAMGFNPLERVMKINRIEKGIEVTTTNEKLAQRIGKSLQRAYCGKIEYKWSNDTKLLRAEWER